MSSARPLFFLLLFTCVSGLSTYAQKETAIWYFGFGAGVDFNSGSPVALTDGQVYSQIGTSSLCDSQGNLLFYTDGTNVWNRTHVKMPNGYDLRGTSFTESSPTVIVPNPANEKIFYIFTVNSYNASPQVVGFTYAVVDLTLQGGLGDVTAKQIPLLGNTASVVTAVRHFNGKDIWVIVHGSGNNNFYAYLVTGTGVTTTPVVSSIGSTCRDAFQKQMKASPDGSKIAHTLNDPTEYFTEQEKLEVFRFNNATGKLTDLIFSINSDKEKYPYYVRNLGGIEFSPNGALLYATNLDSAGSNHVYQFDLNAGSGEAIIKSITRVALPIYGTQQGMQLALNGKIYIVHGGGSDWGTLSSIEFPNVRGPNCKYVEQSVSLAGKSAIISLPIFIQSYFANPPTIESTGGCVADSIAFQAYSIGGADSVKWNFGEPLSGKANASGALNPKHKFASAGIYQVTLTTYLAGTGRQLSKTITVHPVPLVSLGPDTAVCAGVPYRLSGGSWAKYRWSTGDTTAAVDVTTSGTYWLEASNGYCTGRDTIKIQVLPVPKVNLGADIATCDLPPLTFDAGNAGFQYHWSTGSTSQKINITESGDYWVKVYKDKCYEADTIRVRFLNANDLVASVQNDSLSYNESAQFTATGSNVISWVWGFGDGTTSSAQHAEHLYQEEGLYEVTLLTKNANQCSTRKTLYVYQEPHLFIPNVFTPNADGKNDQFVILYNGQEPYHLVVVNRWGKEMFNSNDKSSYWNGTNGENGVYFYRLQTGKTSYKGWIHLLR